MIQKEPRILHHFFICARVESTPYIGDKLMPPLIGNPYK